MRYLLLAFLWLLPLTAFGQIGNIRTEYGDMLPSRGAFSVIYGQNLSNGLTEMAVDVAHLPTDLGGVTVDINGVKCGLRYVSPDIIRFVVADETPFAPPVRLRPNILTVRNSAGQVWWSRVFLNDTSPWLLPENHTEWPVGIQFSQSGGLQPVRGGAIYTSLTESVRVQLWATGARSFYPADWVSYYVYLIDAQDNIYALPALVHKFESVQGVDIVTFDVPPEYANLGEVRLILQTPSAFSQEVKVTLSFTP